jgi:hypothetical protein
MREIFRSKRDEVTGEWRKLHNKELNNLHCSPNIVKVIRWRMRWAWHVACLGEMKTAYRILVMKREGKRTLGRPIYRWKNNNKMDLEEVALTSIGLIGIRMESVNETCCSVQCGDMIDWLTVCMFNDAVTCQHYRGLVEDE